MIDILINKTWFTQLSRFQSIFVGFSGGVDSTVLLHKLSQNKLLSNKIHAIHIHHGLSINADAWEEHCSLFCKRLNIPFQTHHVHIAHHANIEEQARIARYQVFQSILGENDVLVLGHHEADQAETLLLQLMRGAGVEGLGAMEAVQTLGKSAVMKPLLTCSKQQILKYAKQHHLHWIEDESNQNERFTRNYIRHHIIPLLALKWPSVIQSLARTAHHCQQAQKNLDDLALMDCEVLSKTPYSLCLNDILHLPPARLKNVLRAWLKQCDCQYPSTKVLKQIVENIIFAHKDTNPEVRFANHAIRRFRNNVYLLKNRKEEVYQDGQWSTFPAPYHYGSMDKQLFVKFSSSGFSLPPNAHIEVRFRKGGELLRLRGQTKSLKKLFQEWGVPPWIRAEIPLLYVNNVLYVVVGYAVSDVAFDLNDTLTPKLNIYFGDKAFLLATNLDTIKL